MKISKWFILLFAMVLARPIFAEEVEHRLYVVAPGIRNYLEFGGAGILVFDMDHEYRFLKRIETTASRKEQPENIKGVCANASTGRLYFSTPTTLYCVDLLTERSLWNKELPNGCDRMSMTPDGKTIYVPSFEKDTWNVVDAASGNVISTLEPKSGAHNTVCGLDGSRMYLAGLKSPLLNVADTKTHELLPPVGPFSASIRPFTVNGAGTRAYVCVNELLGFEIGDLVSGKQIARVEVSGFSKGPVARHGCPSHGIALSPDEREIWLCDAHNRQMHVFSLRKDPPELMASIELRDEPGWITFSIDGSVAIASTGEVIDAKTKSITATLVDEKGRQVHSEKMLEIQLVGGKPHLAGDQFGIGRVSAPVAASSSK